MLHLPGKVNLKEIPESEWRGTGNKFSVPDFKEESVYEAELELFGDNPEDLKDNDSDDEMDD
jgi:hypothetical protein